MTSDSATIVNSAALKVLIVTGLYPLVHYYVKSWLLWSSPSVFALLLVIISTIWPLDAFIDSEHSWWLRSFNTDYKGEDIGDGPRQEPISGLRSPKIQSIRQWLSWSPWRTCHCPAIWVTIKSILFTKLTRDWKCLAEATYSCFWTSRAKHSVYRRFLPRRWRRVWPT